MDGGFPEGTLILALGSPLSGLDWMARQFWEAEEGKKGAYLIFDEEPGPGMTDAREILPDMLPDFFTGDRIVVDSVSSLLLKSGLDQTLQCIKKLKQEVKSRGANAMITMYAGVHSPEEETRILRAADVVIELRVVILHNMIERQVVVYKIKGAAVPWRVVPFIITDKGIELSTTSRVV